MASRRATNHQSVPGQFHGDAAPKPWPAPLIDAYPDKFFIGWAVAHGVRTGMFRAVPSGDSYFTKCWKRW